MQTIIILSVIMWVFIDWMKSNWESVSWGRWITIGLSAFLGVAQAFLFDLDLLVSLDVVTTATPLGHIYAGLCICGGSALIYKLLQAFRTKVELE